LALSVLLALISFGTELLAFQAGEKISLMATKKHPNASGTVVVNETTIKIDAKGLKYPHRFKS
jgi:hypothetical protein